MIVFYLSLPVVSEIGGMLAISIPESRVTVNIRCQSTIMDKENLMTKEKREPSQSTPVKGGDNPMKHSHSPLSSGYTPHKKKLFGLSSQQSIKKENNVTYFFKKESHVPRAVVPSIKTIGLTECQQQTIDYCVQERRNVFLTGGAGTGKSYLLRHIYERSVRLYGADRVQVTATTGVAACNIGGVTLHQFAGRSLCSDVSNDAVVVGIHAT